MKSPTRTLFASLLLSLLSLAAASARAGEEPAPTCEDFRCQFQARLEADCPCDGQDNHGSYVSCVAHIVNDLVDEGLPTNCKGKIKRCAARSVCGKQDRGFATCTTQTFGTCTSGTCENDAAISCATNTDCGVVSSQCRLTRHTDTCTASGGLVNLSPTCCATCNTAE